MNDNPLVGNLLFLKMLPYDISVLEGNNIGYFVRSSLQKHDNTVGLLEYKNHIRFESNIKAIFQSFRFPDCDTFSFGAPNLERHLTTRSERAKIFYTRNVNQIRETQASWTLLDLSTRTNKNSSEV